MNPIIKPCRVPWAVSPTMGGLTLTHMEDDQPSCSVVFGGGRLRDDGLTDDRRIEINFDSAYCSRFGLKGDDSDIDESGFTVLEKYAGPWQDYLEWRERSWRDTGLCPDSGFYVATQSCWADSIAVFCSHVNLLHFVLAGRDAYIEVLASRFRWREWLWLSGNRDQHTNPDDVVGFGDGVE